MKHSNPTMAELSTIGPPLGLKAYKRRHEPRAAVLDWHSKHRAALRPGLARALDAWRGTQSDVNGPGDFTRDADWDPNQKARGWDKWLKLRNFTLDGGEKANLRQHSTST